MNYKTIDKKWPVKALIREKTFQEVVHSWLRDEWSFPHYDQIRPTIPSAIIDSPNFSDENENNQRLQLLRYVRKPMIDPIPSNTEWYVISFKKDDLDRTFIVPSDDWLPLTNNSYQILEAIKNVESQIDHAPKIREVRNAIERDSVGRNLILVTSSLESPFTIIEGNHRAVAFTSKALDETPDMIIEEVFLGVSPQMKDYIWHIESRLPGNPRLLKPTS